MRLFENANFPFIPNRRFGYGLSILLVTVSLAAILVKGLQYGIDFNGGTEVVIELGIPVPPTEIRTILGETIGAEPMVRTYGSEYELQIRTADIDSQELTQAIERAFKMHLPENTVNFLKVDTIGPVFAQDMRDAAGMATLLSVLVIALYIFIRFKKFSFSFVVLTTLIHDVIIILGVFTLLNGILPFNMDIDQSLVAAFLTIIGYSLNDTIVVFDRIRENMIIYKGKPWNELVNTSVNQTLSRTVVTSLTTLFAVLVLFIAGGATLKGFSFAILVGVILGTYSTIFISCPLLVDIFNRKEQEVKKNVPAKTGDFSQIEAA